MSVNIGDVIVNAVQSDMHLFDCMWKYDQEALGGLQYVYLLAFEDAALTYIYHNPEAKLDVSVPAGGLRFAFRLKTGSYYFALENDQSLTRWLLVGPGIPYYVARITADSLVWTWFYFDRQLTNETLEMYVFDAVIVSPISLAQDVMQKTNSNFSTVVPGPRRYSGRSFGTAVTTSSTVTTTLPSLIEEALDFLLQRWFIVIASVKNDLLKQIEKEIAAFDSVRIQTGQVVGKLAEGIIGYVGTGIERTSQITTDFSQAASALFEKVTLAEIRQTEQYNNEVLSIFYALKDIDATAVLSSTGQANVESVRRNVVEFYSKHGPDTLTSLMTLATIELMRRHSNQVSSGAKAVVLGAWALLKTVFYFLNNKVFGSMGVVVNLYSLLKGAREKNELASMMNLIAANLNNNDDQLIEEHALVTVPVSKTKTAAAVSIGLVVVRYLHKNGYLGDMFDTSVSVKDALDLTITTSLPAMPASIVFYVTSQFLPPAPATAFTLITYFGALGYTLYNKFDEKKQNEIDEKIFEAMQRTIATVPKIPEAIGRAADALPGFVLLGAGLVALNSFRSFNVSNLGTTTKENKRSAVIKKRRKQ